MRYRLFAFCVLLLFAGCATTKQAYRDGRPVATASLLAADSGIVLRYGDGPDSCDAFGARDVFVFEDGEAFFMHYDGSGPKGWLCCLAESRDLQTWEKQGPVLVLGDSSDDDSRSASYGVVFREGQDRHLFYLGTRNVSPYPDLIPSPPYLTMKARGLSARGPWEKQKHVVPFRCSAGSYYAEVASPGCVIKDKGEYLQFFSAAARDSGVLLRTLGIARTRHLDSSWTVDIEPILPQREQVENSSLYFEPANSTWFLFTNHVGIAEDEYTDAIWVYWTKDLNYWDPSAKAVVLDSRNCRWSPRVVGLPSVLRVGSRLAVFYDGLEDGGIGHMRRNIGVAWLDLPLYPPSSQVEYETR